ncbi:MULTISPECIES: hypothetical protein [unclassified Paenibacillus]|uniref:hypothetical protein n=1 Tax=unclassified Paenibacillus TaxID=185978 RepID=UPI00095457D9|nr:MULTISPECIES: hypothetical protein [unclassified Paenibacillus]ASS68895.1 hypothetical protein CIC07_24300 [Paenibacillus sp. RUD330]SIR15690.1 hypothetical protein SAMN05880555_3168 [Paenibacillus sp. RU4X]SIR22199.1 hypothetical protein SAMN05880570_2829 [Paenibacillus sp. RU4T]
MHSEPAEPTGAYSARHADGAEAIRSGLERVREMLAKTEQLMGAADERTRRVEQLTQRASELLGALREGAEAMKAAEKAAAEETAKRTEGGADKPARGTAPARVGLDEAAGIEELVRAITGEIRELQRERLPFLSEAASGGRQAVKDNQYE